MGRRYAVGHLERIVGIQACGQAALAQITIGLIGSDAIIVVAHQLAVDVIRRGIGLAQLFGGAHAVIVFGKMLPHRSDLQALHRLQAQRDAARPKIAAIDALIVERIERIALPLRPLAGEAQIDAVVDDGRLTMPSKRRW